MAFRAALFAILLSSLIAGDDAPVRMSIEEKRAPFERSSVVGVQFDDEGKADIAISADARLVRSADPPSTVRPRGPWEVIGCVAFSPDARVAFVGQPDKSVWRWDLETGDVRRTSTSHSGPVCAVALSPDGRLAATGS